MFFHAYLIVFDHNLSQVYAMHIEINKYHLFTLRIHTIILSKGRKVMYELVMLKSKLSLTVHPFLQYATSTNSCTSSSTCYID